MMQTARKVQSVFTSIRGCLSGNKRNFIMDFGSNFDPWYRFFLAVLVYLSQGFTTRGTTWFRDRDVPWNVGDFNLLTRLTTRDFTIVNHHESFRTYIDTNVQPEGSVFVPVIHIITTNCWYETIFLIQLKCIWFNLRGSDFLICEFDFWRVN